jgi:signal transduction histidine kinase
MFALITSFAQTQLMIFFVNILLVSIIFRWQAALLMVLAGVFGSIAFFKAYSGIEHLPIDIMDVQFKMMYGLLLLSSILVAFVKPAQQSSEKQTKLFSEAEKQINEMSDQMLNLLIMKQEFINNINHEIRTPIHQIGASVSAIKQDWNKCSDEQKQEYADIIYQGYQRITEYMDSILDLSDLSTNKIKLKRSAVNLQELTQSVLDECKELYLNDRDLQFAINVEAEKVEVVCDEEKMRQAIRHLIKNAIIYAKKGKIEIGLSNQGVLNRDNIGVPGIKFAIRDEGVGIPEDELSHIFGPFVQSSYTKSKSGGRGLGLALCERIIQIHQGDIWAKNNEGRPGATFFFLIPLK